MIGLILMLVVVGVCLQLLKDKLPIDPTILILIQVIIVLSVVWFIWQMFGGADLPLPRAR